MGFIKIRVHIVWTTKNRKPLLSREIRHCIFNRIKENAEKKGIYIDFINGHFEHVHCLVSLGSGLNIDKILMLLKGESSLNRVREYIKNQKDHHKRKSFNEENQEFMRKYKFDALILG